MDDAKLRFEIDSVIEDVEDELAKTGSPYMLHLLPDVLDRLKWMRRHIQQGTLGHGPRLQFYAKLGRAMLKDYYFVEGPIGRRIERVAAAFAAPLPPGEDGAETTSWQSIGLEMLPSVGEGGSVLEGKPAEMLE